MRYFPSGHSLSLASLASLVLAAWMLAVAPCSWAQSPAAVSPGAAPVARPTNATSAAAHGKAATDTADTAKAISSKPRWIELSPLQQQALMPLDASWDANMSEAQKRKWLELSKSYPSLPADGQTKLHSRMNEWVSLSAQERAEARLNFAKTKELSRQLTADEKKVQWQTYQALSPDEKARLAANATPKPVGAATAVKPVAPQKLAISPAPHTSKGESRPVDPKISTTPANESSKPGFAAPAAAGPTN